MKRRAKSMKQWSKLALAAVCGALLFAGPAHVPEAAAQMAGALGKPLPVGTLSPGTVTVRVIAGAPDKPLIGIDVRLVSPDGNELKARTDSEGRATFKGLTPGSRYVARAQEPAEDGAAGQPKEAASEEFTIPSSGGLRLMISTRPWQTPAAAGGGMPPMMDPRKMSGIPRGDPAVSAGEMTVAAVRGQVTNRIAGHMVHLVGYGADGSVVRISKPTGEDGRAKFDNLKSRIMAYYVMSTFERSGGEGKPPIIDRVRSQQISLPPQVGVRLLLAGLPEDSTEPAVEDQERIGIQAGTVEPGEVLARLTFTAQAKVPSTLALFEVMEGDAAPRQVSTAPLLAPTPVDATGSFGETTQQPDRDVGTLTVRVMHESQQLVPLPGTTVLLEQISQSADTPAQPVAELTTNAQGLAAFSGLTPGAQYRAVLTMYGKRIESKAVAVPPAGGLEMNATVSARIISSADVRFTDVAPNKLYFVEAEFEGRKHRSPPFQMVPGRGTEVSFILYSKPLISFHINAWLDDEYMGFNGQLSIFNTSAMPWNPGPEGVLVSLPEGFVGARVEDEMASLIKVIPEEGLLWRGPLPPGNVEFVAGFSLPVADGKVNFDMDMPMGTYQSSLVFMKNPGMQLIGLPPDVRAFERKARNGRDIYVINNITIREGKSMSFSVAGLPQVPASQRYVKILVGVLVLGLLGWAAVIIFSPRRRAAAAAAAGAGKDTSSDRARARKLRKRREDLLDELVALEAKKKRGDIAGDAYDRARGKLRKQLESVYADLERAGGDQGGDPRGNQGKKGAA